MHPTIGQALAAERVKDWRARAERARQAKIGWRSRFSHPAVGSTVPSPVADSASRQAAEAAVPTPAAAAPAAQMPAMRRPVAGGDRNDRRAA